MKSRENLKMKKTKTKNERRRVSVTLNKPLYDEARGRCKEIGLTSGYVSLFLDRALILANNLLKEKCLPITVIDSIIGHYPEQLNIEDYKLDSLKL